MPLESANFIDQLVEANPASDDPVSQGDDQIRLVKHVLKTTFPALDAAVTATAAELNAATGGISGLQAEIDAAELLITANTAAIVANDVDIASLGAGLTATNGALAAEEARATLAEAANALAITTKQNTLTFGIADTDAVDIDSTTVANGEYAKFTANGLESKSVDEVKTELGVGTIPNVVYLTTGTGEYWPIPLGVTAIEVTVTGPGGGTTSTDSTVDYTGYTRIVGGKGVQGNQSSENGGTASGGDLNIAGGAAQNFSTDVAGGGSSIYGGPAWTTSKPYGSGGYNRGGGAGFRPTSPASAGGTAIKRISVANGQSITYTVGSSSTSGAAAVDSGQGLIVIRY